MKSFRILLCVFLLSIVAPQPSYCQFKQLAKKVTSVFTRKVAKESTEAVAEKSAKAVTKKVSKEVYGEVTKKVLARNSQKSLVKSTEKTVAKDAVLVGREGVERALRNKIVRTSVKGSGRNVVNKSIRHSIVEVAEKSGLRKLGAKESGEVLNAAARSALKHGENKVLSNTGYKAMKEVSQEAIEKAGRSSINAVEKSVQKKTAKVVVTTSDRYRMLRDLNNKYHDPVLRKKQYDGFSPEMRRQMDAYRKVKGDNRYKRIPKKNVKWDGEEGNSLCRFYGTPHNKGYSNMNDKPWMQILKENDIDGITYRYGEPDLSPVSKMQTKMNFDTDISDKARLELLGAKPKRTQLHEEFYSKLAKERHCTVAEIKAYKEKYNLVVHECADCETLMLVPREIHDNLTHSGGVEMYRALNGIL